ncbi:MAG: hypothetical protein A2X25_15040 [Chloroflexi bacterium GWB2_49_20]|nr:MAG: hypothetical protein A2X25_15040 [Chloroflexi bacterium GWB2_49_20]OGN80448.1 MAG: hypothetical protein A2X26_12785 [Chloroflexi bacterium GWC2_49_37]OGN84272.1 MAG: hypothetical protein A2X27_12585 [Chloroflexi bacterium GWD2_49_16]
MLSNSVLDLITGFLSFIFTLMILSYLIGDNPLFRVAIYIFVGVSAGYAASVAWQHVLWPKLFQPLIFGTMQQRLLLVVPLLLGFLLLAKLSPRSARLGNPAMAFLVGTGAAVAIGGAVFGTIFPQTLASINLFDTGAGGSLVERLFEGSIFLIGTVSTLVYFQFSARATPAGPQRSRLVNGVALVGKLFIAVTFGVLFAGAYAAAMTALIERMFSLWAFLTSFF